MTSTTYSRTGGKVVLPGMWEAVRKRFAIDPSQILDPAERYDYDTAPEATRKEFLRLAQQALSEPPTFLRFALDTNNEPIADYPGAEPAGPCSVPGNLGSMDPKMVSTKLDITEDRLAFALTTFTGNVSLYCIPADTTMYRTIGLTANMTGVERGFITNRMLGEFWEPACPNNYPDLAAWRSATAVLAEWNGDYGYIEVRLKSDLWALVGKAGQQHIARVGGMVLPGGGEQYYIPNLQDTDLVEPLIGRQIRSFINETHFGSLP